MPGLEIIQFGNPDDEEENGSNSSPENNEPVDDSETIAFAVSKQPTSSSIETSEPTSDYAISDEVWGEILTDEVIDQIIELTEFLDGFPDHSSNNTIALRRQIVAEYSTEDLVSSITNNDESNWQTNAAFYRATIRELYKRGMPL